MTRITTALLTAACAYPLLAATPATAQTGTSLYPAAGTVELGVFGQYTRYRFEGAGDCPCEWPSNGIGFGGRAAVFLSGGFFLEGEGAVTTTDRILTGSDVRHTSVAARINYAHPLVGGPHDGVSAIIGLGPMYSEYDSFDDPGRWGWSGIAGVRWGVSERLSFRVGGFTDYAPQGRNFNARLRAGVGIRFPRGSDDSGMMQPVEAPPQVVEEPEPEPEVRTDTVIVEQPAPEGPTRTTDASVITAPVFFDLDRSEIRPDARSVLELKLAWLQANPDLRLQLAGHADERGTSPYNQALGMRRSRAIESFLLQRGVSAGALTTQSLGDTRLTCMDQSPTEQCHQSNRRVNFIILSNHPEGYVVPRGVGGR